MDLARRRGCGVPEAAQRARQLPRLGGYSVGAQAMARTRRTNGASRRFRHAQFPTYEGAYRVHGLILHLLLPRPPLLPAALPARYHILLRRGAYANGGVGACATP